MVILGVKYRMFYSRQRILCTNGLTNYYTQGVWPVHFQFCSGFLSHSLNDYNQCHCTTSLWTSSKRWMTWRPQTDHVCSCHAGGNVQRKGRWCARVTCAVPCGAAKEKLWRNIMHSVPRICGWWTEWRTNANAVWSWLIPVSIAGKLPKDTGKKESLKNAHHQKLPIVCNFDTLSEAEEKAALWWKNNT